VTVKIQAVQNPDEGTTEGFVIATFYDGTELDVILRASQEDLRKGLPGRVAEGVLRVREGKVNIQAGFDGEYGTISIFGEEKQDRNEEQLSLF